MALGMTLMRSTGIQVPTVTMPDDNVANATGRPSREGSSVWSTLLLRTRKIPPRNRNSRECNLCPIRVRCLPLSRVMPPWNTGGGQNCPVASEWRRGFVRELRVAD